MARLLCAEMGFTLTSDPVEAVRDADYVITTIRVGQDEMRAKDERIALDHGVLGQETTGAAGCPLPCAAYRRWLPTAS